MPAQFAMNRKAVLRQLKDIDWAYALGDDDARQELAVRISRTGRAGAKLIPYSNLVAGVVFTLPNVNGGHPFAIDTHNWTGLDRRIIGDFLGYISARSFEHADFFASALVVDMNEGQPSHIFFEWMRSLGCLPDSSDKTITAFWVDQVTRAVQWYKAHPQGFSVLK